MAIQGPPGMSCRRSENLAATMQRGLEGRALPEKTRRGAPVDQDTRPDPRSVPQDSQGAEQARHLLDLVDDHEPVEVLQRDHGILEARQVLGVLPIEERGRPSLRERNWRASVVFPTWRAPTIPATGFRRISPRRMDSSVSRRIIALKRTLKSRSI